MASEQAELLRALVKEMPPTWDGPLDERRQNADDSWSAGATEPEGVTYEAVDAGGVPAEWAMPEGATGAAVLLYFHGGGYVLGSVASHRRLVGHLALAIGCRALSVDYRLAPEHPFPAAVEDAATAYRWLLAQGIASERVVVGGDSAGGGLSVAALLELKSSGDPLPAGAILLSPWTDLAGTGDSLRTRSDVDVFVDGEALNLMVADYLAGGDARDPLASPLYGDLNGLPPLCIHVGDHEILLDDSTRLADRAKHAGVEVDLEIWPEMLHVFQAAAGNIPESDESIAAISALGQAGARHRLRAAPAALAGVCPSTSRNSRGPPPRIAPPLTHPSGTLSLRTYVRSSFRSGGRGCAMCELRSGVLSSLRSLVGALDPSCVTGEQAKALLEDFAEMERLARAGVTLCAGRVAETGAYARSGARTAAEFVAGATGTPTGEAIRVVETSRRVASLPGVEDALRSGELSGAAAAEVAEAASADPQSEAALLATARQRDHRQLRQHAERVKAAKAREEDLRAREARLQHRRSLRTWTDAEGAVRLDGRFAPLQGAAILAAIEAEGRRVFREAHSEGRRDPAQAYLADALLALCERGSQRREEDEAAAGDEAGDHPAGDRAGRRRAGRGAASRGPDAGRGPGRSAPAPGRRPASPEPAPGARRGRPSPPPKANVAIRVDLTALRRGRTVPGERCEIAGVGPVSVATVTSLIGESWLDLIVTNGRDVTTICGIGRTIPRSIRVALEARDQTCVVPSCSVTRGLEIDHYQVPYANGGPTALWNLARLCHHHHVLKTHEGYALVGGPGEWQWLAPVEANEHLRATRPPRPDERQVAPAAPEPARAARRTRPDSPPATANAPPGQLFA